MADLRQSPAWAYYISHINWKVKKVGKNQVFIRKIPLIGRSFMKFQRPAYPVNFTALDKIAREEKALCLVIEPTIEKHSDDALKKNGFRKAPKMTLTHTASIHVDLNKSQDEIFKSFSENARRNIRKSEKENLSVKVVDLKKEKDDREFRKFYDLFTNLTKIKKFWAPDYIKDYHKKYLGFKNSSYLLFAEKDKKPIASVWLGVFDQKSWYINTGITEEGYKKLANYLLVWEAIKLSKKLHLKTFDFEGIYDPRFPKERVTWKNFSEFKKRFHGQIIEYPVPYIKIYSKAFKIFYICTNKLYS